MYGFTKVYVIGTDVDGRQCRVAQVSVPTEYIDRAFAYVKQQGYPHAIAVEYATPNGEVRNAS